MREKLIALIERASIRAYVRALKKDEELLAWVMEVSKTLPPDAELSERVYVALHGDGESICQYGNRKIFNALNKGYRFCAPDCRCRREAQSRKMTEHHKEIGSEGMAERIRKQQETLLQKYGVTNAAKLDEVKQKAKATNRAKYGVDHPMQTAEVQQRLKETIRQRYGVDSPLVSEEIKSKIRQTNLERYGAEHTMHLARAAFTEKYGVDNPFKLEQFQEKARLTMLARYGVEKALNNPKILERMADRIEKKYGVRNIMLAPSIRRRIEETVRKRYGRISPNQSHFSDESYAILQDPDSFRAMFEGRSLREVAMTLGVAYDTTRKYCAKYGIELPKSSYEDAIADLLREHGFHVRCSDRTIIYPQEIDILVPDKKLGIEFCGLYWHTEANKRGKTYHLDKMLAANKAGYRLVTIFEDEWVYRRHAVEARLLHILGVGGRGFGARKLAVREIDAAVASEFLERYHTQGAGPHGFAKYGAFAGGDLVAVMTFSKPRLALGRKKDGPIELLRFATDGRNHPGVASKLFRTFVREHNPKEIISYADRRWSEGGLYRALGFQDDGATAPNYWYFHPSKLAREHRFKFRKDRIVDLVENGREMTEVEIMEQLGYRRLWDCGNLRFRWTSG